MGSRCRIAAFVAGLVLTVVHVGRRATRRDAPPPPPPKPSEKLVYADFEEVENGKPVSARGGAVSLSSYQESDLQQDDDQGRPDGTTRPSSCASSRTIPTISPSSISRFMAPNQWAGAALEIKGQPDVDGKTPADDVTGFKKITFQLYAKGAETVRVEAISRGHGVDLQAGYPQMTFKVKPGLNTYEVALKALVAARRGSRSKLDPKKILQKLTALSITAYCDAASAGPTEGMLIVDNIAFEK